MSTDGIFMSLASALGPESKSFEEIRVEDYIRSYQSTGRPPIPVPQEPADERERKALNLPPLFKPQTNITLLATGVTGNASSSTPSSMLSSTLGSTSTTSLLASLLPNTTTPAKPRIVNAVDIPVGQEFRTHILAAEKYQTIVCMPEYEGFSSEELRYYAYLRGNITSPVTITMDPFVAQAKELPTSALSATPSEDKLQSQCALPEYSRHSPEELRVAFMAFGREMTSNDILGPQVPAATGVTPATPNDTPIASLAPAVVPPPVIAAAPSASKFNFVFR